MSDNPGTIVVYGTTWCPDCRRAKQFFSEHRIEYAWVNIEDDPEATAYVREVNRGRRVVPTIVFPDGDVLVEPSNVELAERLGLQTKAEKDFYDVVIVGGGPTGLTASIYTTRDGLDTLVITKTALGGQVGVTQVLDNFPGFDEGISGEEFARRLSNQARRFGAELLEAQEVTDITRQGQYLCVNTAAGGEYGARAVLIASGSKYRQLNVPGEDELIGINIHFCATCDAAFYRDEDVLVIGGGNSGFEESLFIIRFARRVTIVEYQPRIGASSILQEKVAQRDDITVVLNHAVNEFRVEDGELAGVLVQDRATAEVKEWHPDGVFVFVGMSPNSDFLPGKIERDERGFVKTGGRLMTAMEGVFAAGDVRSGSTKQAASAVGEGATAALMIRQYLEAS